MRHFLHVSAVQKLRQLKQSRQIGHAHLSFAPVNNSETIFAQKSPNFLYKWIFQPLKFRAVHFLSFKKKRSKI